MLLTRSLSSTCLLASLAFLPLTTFAQECEDCYLKLKINGGIGWLQADDATLGVTEIETDTITFGTSDVAGIAGLGIGYVFPLTDEDDDFRWFPAIETSIDGSYQFETDFNGNVYQFENTDMNNYTNNTHIENANFMFNVTLPLAEYQRWTAFVLGGLGVALTWVEYDDVANEGIPSSGIDLHTQENTTFAWQVGAGLGYEIFSQLDVTLTYLYTDLGSVSTGDSVKSTQEPIPNLSIFAAEFDLQQQSLLLGLEWNFN